MRRITKASTAFIGIFIIIISFILPLRSREIKDMKGNRVTVSDNIRKVFSGSPPLTFMIYAVNPALLAGLNFPIADRDKPYLQKIMHTLPVLGGFFGQGNVANSEVILKVKPDLLLIWTQRNSILRNRNEEKLMGSLPIPHVYVFFENINDYEEAFLFMGKLFNMEERASILADYAKKTLAEIDKTVSSIPADQRPTVYYAEGKDGLNTDCDKSWHAELINIAGAKNVRRCNVIDSFGMERISMEQVMMYNPEVIIVQEESFHDRIYASPLWKDIKAVKTKRVYLVPRVPFNWFDRPPSFMRLIGIKWLMNNLYHSRYRVDIVKEAKYFYRLFLGIDKTTEEIRRVIYP